MFETEGAKLIGKPLTDLRVSETGRPNLYTSRAHEDVFQHIGGRLYAAQAHNWDFHSFRRLPDEPEGDWPDGRAAQAAGWVPQTGLPRTKVDRHGGVGVGNGQCISPFGFDRMGHKRNVCG